MPDLDMDHCNKATFTDQSIKLFSKRIKRSREYIACGKHQPLGCSDLHIENVVDHQHTTSSGGDLNSNQKQSKLLPPSADTFSPRLLRRERSWAVIDVSNQKSKRLQSQSAVEIHELHTKEQTLPNKKWSAEVAPVSKHLSHQLSSKSSANLPRTVLKTVEDNAPSSTKPNSLKSPSMSTLASRSVSSFQEAPLYKVRPKRPNRPKTASGGSSLRPVRAQHASVSDVHEARPQTAQQKNQDARSPGRPQEPVVQRPKTASEGASRGTKYRSWAEFFKKREGHKKPKPTSKQNQEIPSSKKSSTGSRRRALKNQIATQRVDTYQNLRTRSPSPGITNQHSQRSRSLSSRRPDTASRPPSGRHTSKRVPDRDTSASRCSSSHSRSRQRRSSVPYVKWKQNTEQARNSPSEGMNGESLPPLQSNRSESALSKRSSRESLLSAGSSIPRGSILKHEKPLLISIDDPVSPVNPVKRSHLSPASANSGSSNNSKGNGSIPRNKSWAALDSTCGNKPGQLETLFEQKGHTSVSHEVVVENGAIAESAIDSGYNSYSKSRNMKTQPREQRRGSVVSSTVNGKISPGKRTQSVSNITNASDTSIGKEEGFSNANKGGKRELPRIRSENTLSVPHTAMKAPTSPRAVTQNQSTLRTTNGKSFNRTKSQPALMQNDSELNERNLQRNIKKQTKQKHKENTTDEQEEGASDGEKNYRIVEWLIGVQSADRPPSPFILEEEEPPQTDTAIHVVYNGDR